MNTKEILELAETVRIGFGRYEIVRSGEGWFLVDVPRASYVNVEGRVDGQASFVYVSLEEAYERLKELTSREL